MAKRNLKGIWNFTNSGVMSQHEILHMYREYIDLEFKWSNFTLEEHHGCPNEMDASKLKKEFPELLPIKESLIKYVVESNRETFAM